MLLAPTVQLGAGPPALRLQPETPFPHTTTSWPGPGGLVTPEGHTGPTPRAPMVLVLTFARFAEQKGPVPHAASLFAFTPEGH